MKNYVQYLDTGEIVAVALTETPEKFGITGLVLELSPDVAVDAARSYVKGGVLVSKPERSSRRAVFDYAAETWVEPELTPDELVVLGDQVRMQRNELLTASDWTQVSDAPVDQAAWALYRQALRDLPSTTTDPRNPDWPKPPV